MVEIIKIFLIILDIFGITVPGNKVETETVTGHCGKQGFDPGGIKGGNGRTTNFVKRV